VKPSSRTLRWRTWVTLSALLSISVGMAAAPGSAATATTTSSTVSSQTVVPFQNVYSWGPVSVTCLTNQSCRVRASGGKGYQFHLRGNTIKAQWFNTGVTTRTSYHGSGSQTARVQADTSLANASAVCVCVASPCAM